MCIRGSSTITIIVSFWKPAIISSLHRPLWVTTTIRSKSNYSIAPWSPTTCCTSPCSADTNPRTVWTYLGEDYMQRIKKIVGASQRGTPPHIISEKVIRKYVTGLSFILQGDNYWAWQTERGEQKRSSWDYPEIILRSSWGHPGVFIYAFYTKHIPNMLQHRL